MDRIQALNAILRLYDLDIRLTPGSPLYMAFVEATEELIDIKGPKEAFDIASKTKDSVIEDMEFFSMLVNLMK